MDYNFMLKKWDVHRKEKQRVKIRKNRQCYFNKITKTLRI